MEAVQKGICAISAILVTRVHGVIREVNTAAIHRFEQDSRCADLVLQGKGDRGGEKDLEQQGKGKKEEKQIRRKRRKK